MQGRLLRAEAVASRSFISAAKCGNASSVEKNVIKSFLLNCYYACFQSYRYIVVIVLALFISNVLKLLAIIPTFRTDVKFVTAHLQRVMWAVAYRGGGGWGVQPHPEIPKF